MQVDPAPSNEPIRRAAQLVGSCLVLGAGVGLLLLAALGSDGYSTLINGLSLHFGVDFILVNAVVGTLFVALAWLRGLRPGVGTIVQPVVVGFTVSGMLAAFSTPSSLGVRIVLLLAAFPVLAAGVAGYLDSGFGAGPTEAAALAWDPPLPFRWSNSVLQGMGALVGWLLGAAFGPGTLAVIFLLGPLVDLISRRILSRRAQPASSCRRATNLSRSPCARLPSSRYGHSSPAKTARRCSDEHRATADRRALPARHGAGHRRHGRGLEGLGRTPAP